MNMEKYSIKVSQSGLPSVPWKHEQAPGLKIWTWETTHFVATILSDNMKYIWYVAENKNTNKQATANNELNNIAKSPATTHGVFVSRNHKGIPPPSPQDIVEGGIDILKSKGGKFLKEGGGKNFSDAEKQIREFVGKSYHEALGYKKWAGDLAHTFTTANGERFNFDPYVGYFCQVKVVSRDGGEETFSGVLGVENYHLLVENDSKIFKILPGGVTDVVSSHVKNVLVENTTRVYLGSKVRGCTGKTGFRLGTVEHTGMKCPIHEE